jgi:hypothetical protein
MTVVDNFISMLMNSRTQTHYFHLNTNSYAQHKALEKYYTGIVPLIDAYSETYTKKVKPVTANKRFMKTPGNIIPYFKDMLRRIKSMKLPTDTHLKAIEDDIVSLIHRTLYMLKLK